MRKTFPGYYRPSEVEFKKLWSKCLFVLDANVLLNLYRYSEETREKLVGILQRVQSRLWVPHQAAWEYQRNRLDVISAQREAYRQIEQLLRDIHNKLDAQLKGYKRHPLINAEQLLNSIDAAFDEQIKALRDMGQKHPDLLKKDTVRETLTELLDGKVGPPYPESKLKEIFKEGSERYAKSIPPGFKDAKDKDGDRAFGDLVLWFQVIDKATKDKSPIIVVTDDAKEDWWWRHEGKIVGPHPELIEEIRNKAKVDFYMYVPDQFMEFARQFLKEDVDQKAIDEIREVRKQEEVRRTEIERFLISQEKQQRQLEHFSGVVDLEIRKLESEIASLSRQITDIQIAPSESKDLTSSQELTSRLGASKREMEDHLNLLERRKRALLEDIDLLRTRRNMTVHLGIHDVGTRDAALPASLRRSLNLNRRLRERLAEQEEKADADTP